jgi:uncharacterized protein (TIGR02145 family)
MKKNKILFYQLILLGFILITFNCCKKEDKEEEPDPVNTVSDIDGNEYTTITLGVQTWMVENLKVTRLNDGTAITLVSDNTAWTNLKTTPGYCWYDNDQTTYKDKQGALYNWYAVNTQKLAPKGWHVPTDVDWTSLEKFLEANGYNFDGSISGNKIAKAMASTSFWKESIINGSIGNTDFSSYRNKSGFTAVPSGDRRPDGTFHNYSLFCTWWSVTASDTYNAWVRYLGNTSVDLKRVGYLKENGFSVRCIKD